MEWFIARKNTYGNPLAPRITHRRPWVRGGASSRRCTGRGSGSPACTTSPRRSCIHGARYVENPQCWSVRERGGSPAHGPCLSVSGVITRRRAMPDTTTTTTHGSYLMPSLEHATVADAMHPGILSVRAGCDPPRGGTDHGHPPRSLRGRGRDLTPSSPSASSGASSPTSISSGKESTREQRRPPARARTQPAGRRRRTRDVAA